MAFEMADISALESKMRLKYLDCLKGFLIMLVVWGHVVQNAAVDFFSTVSFRTIYSFHMATFFFISGIVLQLGRHGVRTLFGKMQRLLIPYLSWYVLCIVVFQPVQFSKAFAFAFSSKSVGLWFLFTLVECIVACAISEAVAPKRWEMPVIGLIMVGLAVFCRNQYVDLMHFAKFYQYYLGGYLMAARCEWIVSPQRSIGEWNCRMIVLASVVFVVGLFIAAITRFGGMKFQIYKVIVSWAGCMSLLALFRVLSQRGVVINALSTIGKMTLGIYAVHIFLLLLCGVYVRTWPLGVTFAVLLVVSTVIVVVIKRVPLLAIVLLGRS